MPKEDSSDIMMRFLDQRGQPIVAEGRAKLISTEKDNPLLIGFKNPYIFEIDRFTFSAGRKDNAPGLTGKPGKPGTVRQGNQLANSVPVSQHHGLKAGKSGFPGDLQPTSFTRSIDASSPVLIQNCIDRAHFERISLIKRRPTGGPAAGEVFLRLDFLHALITDVQWSNDDEVQETCKFICRRVCINYRPQLPDGSLGAPVQGYWSMVPNDTISPPLV
jgi:type VI protein secretion system component Hcp